MDVMRRLLPADAPPINSCRWIGDLRNDGATAFAALQARYGSVNVTVAPSVWPDAVGVYVRGDVLDGAENPLRSYLR